MTSQPLPEADKLEDDNQLMFLFDSVRSEAKQIDSSYFNSKFPQIDDYWDLEKVIHWEFDC
jgi:hypothetical protein